MRPTPLPRAALFAACTLLGSACVTSEIDTVLHNDVDAVSTADAGADATSGEDATLDAAGDTSAADAGSDVDVADVAPPDDTTTPDTVADAGPETPFEPAPATLHRLTSAQYRATVRDLLGVEYTGALEADTSLHGFVSVAASDLTLSPRAAEQFEEAAWTLASSIVDQRDSREAFFGCDVAADGELCLRGWLTRFVLRAWRRPVTGAELDTIVAVANDVATELRDPWQGARAALALALQSPHFLFRVERGEAAPEHPGWRRYTDWEMASRLSYALWGTMPDDLLLQAAGRGELTQLDTLRAHVARLLADPRALARLTGFFEEFVGLEELAGVSKDAEMFPEYTPELREAMQREVELLFQEYAFGPGADFRDLLTTNVTFVNAELAALYGIPYVGDGTYRTTLPESAARGGLLGRAALLSLFSHATLNSPTHRGKFIRADLLCQDVPPPPPGVVSDLANNDATGPQTLRQRLSAHLSDELCASCHAATDPLGFPLEHFDPIGRWRDLDNGLPIDATGEVDGVPVDGAAELGAALAQHPDFSACVARRMYRYSTGQLERFGEMPLLDDLALEFEDNAYSFGALVEAIVTSDGFRYAIAPASERCSRRNETRACTTACGTGVETCLYGTWQACTAPPPVAEVCDGLDNNCDGQIDEGVIEACDGATCGAGTRVCTAGVWGECTGPSPRTEVCNGSDDDCDGAIDEDVAATTQSFAFYDLMRSHEGCDGTRQRIGDNCNSAIHRRCASLSCAATGFGPLESGAADVSALCLPEERVVVRQVAWAELAARHAPCNGTSEYYGPNCNAAIHRWCAANGHSSGWGPVEHTPDGAWVACAPDSRVFNTTYTVLNTHHENCSQGGERMGPNCNAAIHRFCRANGFESGWGPVENFEDVAVVSCVSSL